MKLPTGIQSGVAIAMELYGQDYFDRLDNCLAALRALGPEPPWWRPLKRRRWRVEFLATNDRLRPRFDKRLERIRQLVKKGIGRSKQPRPRGSVSVNADLHEQLYCALEGAPMGTFAAGLIEEALDELGAP